jgi:hypothetical protein
VTCPSHSSDGDTIAGFVARYVFSLYLVSLHAVIFAHDIRAKTSVVSQIFCSACSSEKMDGAPFGVPHSLRVCVKCKGFEKSIPSRGGKAGMILSSLQSTPPAPTPFVPLFAPALHPDDNASRIDLESFGGELIRECGSHVPTACRWVPMVTASHSAGSSSCFV